MKETGEKVELNLIDPLIFRQLIQASWSSSAIKDGNYLQMQASISKIGTKPMKIGAPGNKYRVAAVMTRD